MLKTGSFLIYGANREAREGVLSRLSSDLMGDLRKASADLVIIEPDGSIGIEKIRDLQARLKFKPQEKSLKLAIIRQAHLSTIEAQNALLKTLEEPPRDSIILIETSLPAQLLPTIVSRCQRIFVGDKAQVSLTQEEQETLLRENKIVFSGDLDEKFSLAHKLSPEASAWLERESLFCRKLLLLQLQIKKPSSFKSITDEIEKFARKFKVEEICAFLKLIIKIRKAILGNVNSRLSLEILFLEASKFA